MRRGPNKVGRGWTAKGGKIRKDQDGTKACSDRRQLKHRKQAKGTGDAMIVRCRFVSQPGVGVGVDRNRAQQGVLERREGRW